MCYIVGFFDISIFNLWYIYIYMYIYIYVGLWYIIYSIDARRPGVPPKGLSRDQLFRVCLGCLEGLLRVHVGLLGFLPRFWKDFTFRAYLGFDVRFRFQGFVFSKQVSSAKLPFHRHANMQKNIGPAPLKSTSPGRTPVLAVLIYR